MMLANKNTLRFSPLHFGIGLALVLLPILIYYPGLHGPFIFDDYANIVLNTNIQIKEITFSTLREAAHSLHSGEFGRDLAGVSFAINYYLAHGFSNTFGFKVFNLSVHIINSLLVFWFVSLIYGRILAKSITEPAPANTQTTITILSGITAIIWAIHPIQLTSVLYVVQRMTSMAATFILLALIAYFYARTALARKETRKSVFYLLLALVSGIISLNCKETALLLPLYIGLFEFILFCNETPWSRWNQASRTLKVGILVTAGVAFVVIVAIGVHISLPNYVYRNFTMIERVLTETRVLIFYLGLIFIPRLNAFTLYHDDIHFSTSLISPWTTLVSIIIIISILIFAFRVRKKSPLLAFGVFWFFISHALESSFYPLELVHEHRNYLASLGPIIITISAFYWVSVKLKSDKIWLVVPLIALSLCVTTTVRSMQWSTKIKLLEAETFNHPDSPRAWSELFNAQIRANMPNKAITSIENAIRLDPKEPAYYLALYLYTKSFDRELANFAYKKLIQHIPDKPESIPFGGMLLNISICLDTTCKDMQNDFSIWVREIIKYSDNPRYKYFMGMVLYAEGDLKGSLRFLDQSIKDGNSQHANPIIKRIQVLLALRKFSEARSAYAELLQLNKKYKYVSAASLRDIEQVIRDSEQSQKH